MVRRREALRIPWVIERAELLKVSEEEAGEAGQW